MARQKDPADHRRPGAASHAEGPPPGVLLLGWSGRSTRLLMHIRLGRGTASSSLPSANDALLPAGPAGRRLRSRSAGPDGPSRSRAEPG